MRERKKLMSIPVMILLSVLAGFLIWLLFTLFLLWMTNHNEAHAYVLAPEATEGLPENLPDLYDAKATSQYELVSQGPYPGCACERTVLKTSSAWGQYQSGQRTPILVVLGFLTDLKTHRIVAVAQTFYYLDSGLRSARGWIDVDWSAGRPPDGHWKALHEGRISPPGTAAEAKAYLRELYQAAGQPIGQVQD